MGPKLLDVVSPEMQTVITFIAGKTLMRQSQQKLSAYLIC